MLVKDVMCRDVKSVEDKDLVSKAARIMREKNIGALPVTHDKKIVGMITDRDIVLRCVAAGKTADNCYVSEVMSVGAAFVTPSQTLSDALAMMSGEQVHRLPVVDGAMVSGMISLSDIARIKHSDTEIAKAICEIAEQ